MITEQIHKERGNVISLELRASNAVADISGTTRMTFKIGDVLVDSRMYSSVFDWSTYGATGRLDLTLGTNDLIKGLPDGSYVAEIVLYDSTYTTGLVWGSLAVIVD